MRIFDRSFNPDVDKLALEHDIDGLIKPNEKGNKSGLSSGHWEIQGKRYVKP